MIELVHQTAVSEFSQVLSILEKLVFVALEHMEKDRSVRQLRIDMRMIITTYKGELHKDY